MNAATKQGRILRITPHHRGAPLRVIYVQAVDMVTMKSLAGGKGRT
jgi:hypothetical protein